MLDGKNENGIPVRNFRSLKTVSNDSLGKTIKECNEEETKEPVTIDTIGDNPEKIREDIDEAINRDIQKELQNYIATTGKRFIPAHIISEITNNVVKHYNIKYKSVGGI